MLFDWKFNVMKETGSDWAMNCKLADFLWSCGLLTLVATLLPSPPPPGWRRGVRIDDGQQDRRCSHWKVSVTITIVSKHCVKPQSCWDWSDLSRSTGGDTNMCWLYGTICAASRFKYGRTYSFWFCTNLFHTTCSLSKIANYQLSVKIISKFCETRCGDSAQRRLAKSVELIFVIWEILTTTTFNI